MAWLGGWTAREVAELLDTTVPAVNSALPQARVTTTTARTATAAALTDRERQVLDWFVRAWHRQDIPALAVLLRDDVILIMPPELEVVIGRDRVTHFLSTVPPTAADLPAWHVVHPQTSGHDRVLRAGRWRTGRDRHWSH